MKRTKICGCGKEFSYDIGRGKDRKHCSPECQYEAFKQKRNANYNSLPKCSTPECNNKANRKGAGLCEGCYMRMRRKGTTDYKALPHRLNQSAGYIWLREPGHPLADSRGLVYEHRFVFYNHNGKGPFKCHWCDAVVDWNLMDVDHLDDNKSNNDISNLVPSCHKCNTKRGTWKMVKARRAEWTQITYEGVTKNASEWAKELGLSRTAFMRRIELWPIEAAMTMPHGKTGPKRRS
jgi:hypothetical protein